MVRHVQRRGYARVIRVYKGYQIKYALAHAQSLRSKAEADDRTSKFNTIQDRFDKITYMPVVIRCQHKYAIVSKHVFHIETMKIKILPR